MNLPDMKPKETPITLPKWEELPGIKQLEMIQILSEMIRRQMEQEGRNEPQQNS